MSTCFKNFVDLDSFIYITIIPRICLSCHTLDSVTLQTKVSDFLLLFVVTGVTTLLLTCYKNLLHFI